MKFEGYVSKGTRVIERKRSVTDGQTARRTDAQTHKAKTICLPQRGGDIISKQLSVITTALTKSIALSFQTHKPINDQLLESQTS